MARNSYLDSYFNRTPPLPLFPDLYAGTSIASFLRGFLRLESQLLAQHSARIKSLRTRLSAYWTFSLKAGLISDSGFHWSPYRDLYT